MRKKHSIIIICLLLAGCDDHYKDKVQDSLDMSNGKSLCYSFEIKYPKFPIDVIALPEPNLLEYNFDKTYKAMHTFTEMGFLTEEDLTIESNPKNIKIPAFRYNLTDEGKLHNMGTRGFCFGRAVVDEITGTGSFEYIEGIYIVNKGKDIHFTYSIQNIPEWVKSPSLKKIYILNQKLNGRLYPSIAKKYGDYPYIHINLNNDILIKD